MLWSWNRVLPVVKWTFQWSVVLPVFFFTRYVPSLFVFISVIIIVAGVCYQLWSGHSVDQSYSHLFYQKCSKLVGFYFCGYYCCWCVLPVVKWTFRESVVLPVFFYQICSKLVRFYFRGYYCCRCVLPVVKWAFRESVVLPVFFLPDMFQACSFLLLWLLLLLVCATGCEVDISWISRTPSFFLLDMFQAYLFLFLWLLLYFIIYFIFLIYFIDRTLTEYCLQ